MSEDPLAAWPNCPIPDCEHKVCLSLDSDLCFPHTKQREFIELGHNPAEAMRRAMAIVERNQRKSAAKE